MGNRSREKFIASSGGLPIIPYGPGMQYANEAAVIAAFPVGTPVYDMAETVEANRMKRIRYVVELNGPDLLTLPILSTDLRFLPWEIEWVCNDLATAQVGLNRIFQILNSAGGAGTSALISKTTQTTIVFEFRNSTGAGLFGLFGTVPASGFFKVKIKKGGTTSGTCQLYVNDVLQSTSATINYSLWTGADQISAISMSDSTTDLRPYQVLNYRSALDGALRDCVEMSESSGATLVNQCDPARPATLSDATAHAKTCVPLSLGG